MDVPAKGLGQITYTQGIEQPGHPVGSWEWPTSTCAHCNTVVYLNPGRQRPRTACKKCYAYICDHCSPAACTPVLQSIELGLDIGGYREPTGIIYHSGATPS